MRLLGIEGIHVAGVLEVHEAVSEVKEVRKRHDGTHETDELHFHTLAEMREMLGIGRLLKEEKIADHRPKAANQTTPAARSDHAAA